MPVYYPRARVVLQVLWEDWADGSREESSTYDVVPRSVTVERNGIREADTWRVELDYQDLPFDPRAVRQMLVASYLDHVGAPNARIRVESRRDLAAIGYHDDLSMRLDEGGEVVTIEGRDYTGLLLDHAWGTASVDVSRPLSQVLQSVLDAVPAAARLDLYFEGGAERVVLANRIGKKRWSPAGRDDDAWTVLVDLCQAAGFLAYVDIDRIVVAPPPTTIPAPAGFVYGENVSSLDLRRNIAEVRTKQVRVVSWDPSAGKATEATFPKKPVVVKKRVDEKGKVKTENAALITFNVSGPWSVRDLEGMAERIYTDRAKEQVEGELRTREMTGLYDRKLTRLKNGDAVEVRVKRGVAQAVAGLDDASARAKLTAPPWSMSQEQASAILTGRKQAEGLATTFYVRSARHEWSRTDGYTLTATITNYVGSRR